jgi:hypothetical protein
MLVVMSHGEIKMELLGIGRMFHREAGWHLSLCGWLGK